MKVVFNKEGAFRLDNPVSIALGTFDGIHIGHQKLIQRLIYYSKNTNSNTAVYTFVKNPLAQLSPDNIPPQISDIKNRINLIASYNIDYLIFNFFNRHLSELSPEDFLENIILYNYNLSCIVVGYNYRFGYKGKGDINLLRKYSKTHDFKLIVVPPVKLYDNVVSSTLIRSLLIDGKVELASKYLGHPHSLYGKVVHGYARGRKIGFPTANIKCNSKSLIPKHGVYLTLNYIDSIAYWGVTNIGNNPTFNCEDIHIESHLLGFSSNIYTKNIRVLFIKRIRDEVKYGSISELKHQITIDIQKAKNFIYKIQQI